MARPSAVRVGAAAALALAVGLGVASHARADGAFPDSLSILLPSDAPGHITLATNFGPVSSDDGGATWTRVCESDVTNCSSLYTMSAAPRDRLMAISADNLVDSDDDACDWTIARGAVNAGGVLDVFPYPNDAARVLAVVSPNGVGAQTAYSVVASEDGGTSFGPVVYTADAGDIITGVEVARSDANTLYVTIAAGQTFRPKLARSTDGGTTWHTADLSATLGQDGIRLISIDHANPARAYLRVSASDGEKLGVYDASDDSVALPLSFPNGLMTAFAELDEGPLLVGGRVNSADAAYARSTDGGATFQAVTGAPHLRALAERAGKIYAAADNTADGYALGLSTDLGLTFARLMKFADVGGIKSCVRASCQSACGAEVALGLWPASTCTASPESNGKATSSGCGVAASRGDRANVVVALFVVALVAVVAVGARRRPLPPRRPSRAGAQIEPDVTADAPRSARAPRARRAARRSARG